MRRGLLYLLQLPYTDAPSGFTIHLDGQLHRNASHPAWRL